MATAQVRVHRAVIGEDSAAKYAGPLFVVGAFRSGTSFFFSLLNKHSDVALLYEADLGCFYPEWFARRLKSDWFERIEFWNGCMGRHGVSRPADLSRNPTSEDAALWLYKHYAARKEARIFGEKSPSYADCLEELAKKFPGARFIVLWRDPLSVCESVCRAGETSRFFRKSGMVSRVLAHLEKAGAVVAVKVQAPNAPGGRFTKDKFQIDLEKDTVTCPAGRLVQIRRREDGSGAAMFGIACRSCPMASSCTGAKDGRRVHVHVQERLLLEARMRQRSPEWRANYKATRPKVERKLAHLMRRRHGGRRSRVRGTTRIGQDFMMLCAAANLHRLAQFELRSAAASAAAAS